MAKQETDLLAVIPINTSRMLRGAIWVVAAGCAGAAGAVVTRGVNERWQKEYEAVSVEYEGQEFAPHFDGNMFMPDKVLPSGLHETCSWDRRRVGPVVDGLAAGEWTLFDLQGNERGRVTLKAGEPYGPCAFWDATGKRRVSGAYKGSQKRVGLWTLDNVLGEGRKYVLFRPGWSVGDQR